MSNVVAVILARSGSKSIKDKNVKELGGKPLIAWSIEHGRKAGLRTIVSSDSEEYLKIAREYSAETMLRPAELAQDDTSSYAVLKSEIPKISPILEIVVLLSATSPLRKVLHVKMAVNSLTSNLDNYDSLVSVHKVPGHYNPSQVLVTTPLGVRMADGRPVASRVTNRQAYPSAYVTAGGIYIFKTSNLEKGSFWGEKVMLLEVEPSVDLNDMDDWAEAEKILKEKKDAK